MLWKSIALLEAVPAVVVLALCVYALLNQRFNRDAAPEFVRRILGWIMMISVALGMVMSVVAVVLAIFM